jgi:hypothetical protein
MNLTNQLWLFINGADGRRPIEQSAEDRCARTGSIAPLRASPPL